eukprot:TRINITY_DN773_c0_g1_i1.p1 TRINITY_DN773_c0_g1~~TRINITY_DN773_c0_g1_i1.p1  ORF type:complete len:308 (+),score=82.15 TRINITY_DN773_c0_g1_i1:74-997(+)
MSLSVVLTAAVAFIAPEVSVGEKNVDVGKLPTVLMHGMGDSCFNKGMKSITEAVGNNLGSYSVCIPTGDTHAKDTDNGFFMTMNTNVEVFAAKIRNDTQLAGGFNAIGFSQGNSIIRGYIQKYNDPPVKTFLSVHGTVMGVAGFPNCKPDGLLGPVCRILAESLGDDAYTKKTQDSLFQADYFRDPKRVTSAAYYNNSEIAEWNNEGPNNNNQTYKENFVKVERFAMIKALKDTMVFPNAGEWWGQFTPGQFKTVQNMNETEMYQKDLFGLQTVDKQGKILFNSTPGNHLQFTEADLLWWVDNYFLA